MMYTFLCQSKKHEDKTTRQFVYMVHRPPGKSVDQINCPDCGGLAKRDLVADLSTVNTVGSTPISHASSGPGTVAKTTEFAFGRFKKNPDGSVDQNHRPFKDTGELERYANGHNQLGPPKLDDSGNPIRRPDGSMVRTGAKLIQFDPHRRPPVNKRPRMDVPSAWVDSETATRTGAGAKPISFRDAGVPATRYKSPERGKG